MHQLTLDDSSARLYPRSSKSSLSPVIPQLMRKDKEIASLHEEVSQLNVKMQLQEKHLQGEVARLSDKVKGKTRKIKELKAQLKEAKVQLQSQQQQQSQQQPQAESEQCTVRQEQGRWQGHPQRIRGQVIQSILPARKKESPQKVPRQEEVVTRQKDDPVCLEYYEGLLRESQEREQQMYAMLEGVVSKVVLGVTLTLARCCNSTAGSPATTQLCPRSSRRTRSTSSAWCWATTTSSSSSRRSTRYSWRYPSRMPSYIPQLFQRQQELKENLPELKGLLDYFKGDQASESDIEGLYDAIDRMNNAMKVSNLEGQMEWQLREERRRTKESEKSRERLIEKMEELLSLSLESGEEDADVLERLRNCIQAMNRQKLELKQCQAQLSEASEEKKQLLKAVHEQRSQLHREMEEQMKATRKAKEDAQEVIRKLQEEQRYRSREHKEHIHNSQQELVTYYQNLLEENDQEVQFLLSKHNAHVQAERHKLQDQFTRDLELQEQKYLAIFQQLNDELKSKDKQYQLLWKDYQQVSSKSEVDVEMQTHKKAKIQSQLLNSTMITADKENQSVLMNQSQSEHYKQKCKNIVNKKLKQLELVLFHVEHVAKHHSAPPPDQQLTELFQKNPQLEQLVQRIRHSCSDPILQLCSSRQQVLAQCHQEIPELFKDAIAPKVSAEIDGIHRLQSLLQSGADTSASHWLHLLTTNEATLVSALLDLIKDNQYDLSSDSLFGHNWGSELHRLLKRQCNEKLKVECGDKENYAQVLEVIKSSKESNPYLYHNESKDGNELLSIFLESLNVFERRDVIEDIKSRIQVWVQKMVKNQKMSRLAGELMNEQMSLFMRLKLVK